MTKVKEKNQKTFKLTLIKKKLKEKITNHQHKKIKHPSTKDKSQ